MTGLLEYMNQYEQYFTALQSKVKAVNEMINESPGLTRHG